MGSGTLRGVDGRRTLRALALGVLAALTVGCSHFKWPWHHEPPPPPKPVHVLDVTGVRRSRRAQKLFHHLAAYKNRVSMDRRPAARNLRHHRPDFGIRIQKD